MSKENAEKLEEFMTWAMRGTLVIMSSATLFFVRNTYTDFREVQKRQADNELQTSINTNNITQLEKRVDRIEK